MNRWQVAMLIGLGCGIPLFGGTAVELEDGKVNSSARCGECHVEIYSMWQRSMHSLALTDPIFEASYLTAYFETGGKARDVCLRCHAPVASLTGDLDLENPVSREGVTCDFCHSVVSVDLERADRPFRVVLDGTKRGPLRYAQSPAHGVERSALHESAEFCAGCHEYTNADGVAILSTYTEWKASPQAAKGRTCQHCHMPLTRGNTVRADLRTTPREMINLHNISGMHSVDQVRKAATARIVKLRRQPPQSAIVEVEVANVGSGHSIPTGIPTRKLVLQLILFCNDREVYREERTYQKLIVDVQGRPITEDHRAILAAHAIRQDNRLRPGEKRVERFVAHVPPSGPLRADITFRYLYEPKILSTERIAIDIAADRAADSD